MPACHAGGRGFESRPVRQISMIMDILYFIAAIQIGVIVTHLFLTTPIIFKVLKEEEASSFLRISKILSSFIFAIDTNFDK